MNNKALMEEVKKMLFLASGMVAGTVGGKMIDKVAKVDPDTSGLNIKAMLRPLVLTGAGTMGAIRATSPHMRLFASGIGAAGIISGVGVLTKKNLLAGLDNIANLGNNAWNDNLANTYSDTYDMSAERFNPELPALLAPNMGDTVAGSIEYSDQPVDLSNIDIL